MHRHHARLPRPRRHARTLRLVAAAWLFAAAATLAGCATPPPEDALREAVAALEASIEAGDAGDFAGLLSEDFAGPDGMDRAGARQRARGAFLRYRDVGVVTGPLDIELLGSHATVRFTAALSGGAAERWPGGRGGLYRVETGWRLDDGAWRMTSARWERDL